MGTLVVYGPARKQGLGSHGVNGLSPHQSERA